MRRISLIALTALAACTPEKPVDLVYPHLDTANSRWFYFDSASLPFGMVNLSPDTELGGAWGSGYRYHSNEVKGLSHVHAWQLSGLSVMPVVADLPVEQLRDDYFSPFSHDDETVRPGYHRLHLSRYAIDVELTATRRVGFHRYRFPAGSAPGIVFRLSGQLGPSELAESELEIVGRRSLAGYVTNAPTRRRPKPSRVYFFIELDRDIAAMTAWQDDRTFAGTDRIAGLGAGALIDLEPAPGRVLMKVGISYVGKANAKRNMEAELPGWDFDAAADSARDEWNDWLSRIEVSGGTETQRRRFYTDRWHALQGRRIISDADGRYLDRTGPEAVVRQLPADQHGRPEFDHYNSDSFWGAQWTIATLWPLAYPAQASEVGNSLVQYYKDGGLIPRGPSGGNYTFVMTGASSTPFIVSNWMKGIRDFDIEAAYEGLKKNHSDQGLMAKAGYEHVTSVGGGVQYYTDRGYVPFPLPEDVDDGQGYHYHWKGAGQTLEYAFQDSALANFARALGHDEDADRYLARARNYRNLYDAESGFMRPREADGSWREPYDPYEYEAGFVESNAAQMTWFVPHDVDGLAGLMGGRDAYVRRLDDAFAKASELGFTAGSAHADEKDERFSRIPINYGNQPSIQTAFLFAAAGAPWKTQYWSREVVERVFSGLSPETGYNGDEDQGLMGSLAVLMKIGLFQITGGTEPDPVYWIGSPIFDEITIRLDDRYYGGGSFTIKAVNNSSDHRYVQASYLNGAPLQRSYLRHSEIVSGGELRLEMGDRPKK